MFANSVNYAFRHSTIALLTKHKKELEISPLIKNYLGVTVETIDTYDTDELGTFTREKKRIHSQFETARIKALKAIEISGYHIGIGSEGSFCTDPYTGLSPWNIEMVVLIDKKNNIEITGIEQRSYKNVQKYITSPEELCSIADYIKFPQNNLILRPDNENNSTIYKDFNNLDHLIVSFYEVIKKSASKIVFVENDHRAHCSTDRMEAIRYATTDCSLEAHEPVPLQLPKCCSNKKSTRAHKLQASEHKM